jgi:phosphopantothenoylcysteine decarboxylase/phosphopantothenate--cysteine ligase
MSPETLSNRRVVLGVTGSIAAYKAADVASQLGHLGASVHVVLTPSAARFIGAETFRALTRNAVLSDTFDEPFDHQIAHIELAQQTDLILIAPATAHTLAKMALGLADDLLTSILLAATVPVLVAPAMNSAMLGHPATLAHIETLRGRGVGFVEPAHGILACRTEGWGKLADVPAIVQAVVDRLTRASDLAGRHVLVTAGATREPLDPVRFLSNRSSGKMGFAIAEAAARRGAEVALVTGYATATAPTGVTVVRVGTTEEMLHAVEARFPACDALIAAAAPADFAAVELSPTKVKKSDVGGEWTVRLRETPDILATVTAEKGPRVLVGFAAETNNLLAHAREKLTRKNLDLVVANDVMRDGAGFEVDTNIASLVWPDGRHESLPLMSKQELAARIVQETAVLLAARS